MSDKRLNRSVSHQAAEEQTARRIVLRGLVQGIGTRPAILRLVQRHSVQGFVRNTVEGVEVHVEGVTAAVDDCVEDLQHSSVVGCADTITVLAAEWHGFERFDVCAGLREAVLATPVPRDVAVCADCIAEFQNPADRRFNDVFLSCTCCGPRYTILQSMPWEREHTSLKAFPMCACCQSEYTNSRDRRFHAQSMTCPNCGPRLSFRSAQASGDDAIRTSVINTLDVAIQVLRSGGILAVQGLGGLQLLCDATRDTAVLLLRRRKHRSTKPFAVLVAQLDELSESLSSAEMAALHCRTNPIVIVSQNVVPGLAPSVHPGLTTVGVMLPTTSLHWLLASRMSVPLIVTSGNREGEPLMYRWQPENGGLDGLADAVLWHDREILRPVDDSLVCCPGTQRITLRAGRGLAPLPIAVPAVPDLLALGADQKVAIALSNGQQSVLGPHLGDMNTLAARERFRDHVVDMARLYGMVPRLIVHDLHPDYFTSRWAREQTEATCRPWWPVADAGGTWRAMAVQHHHAHVVSGMLEHGWRDRTVLGVAFDGTGYGTDGTVWGGEFLLASLRGFQRVASLVPFPLPGGEQAIREPGRVAVALLALSFPEMSADRMADLLNAGRRVFDVRQVLGGHRLPDLLTLLNHRLSPLTSSMGRLFDGIAAWLMGLGSAGYEGEPAARLEAICDPSETGHYALILQLGHPAGSDRVTRSPQWLLDWRPMIRQIASDLRAGQAAGRIAMKFHRAVAMAIEQVADLHAECPVVLSGGCFQNRTLVTLLQERWMSRVQPLGVPVDIPPNDGGLAAGQLAIAAAAMQNGDERSVAS